MYRHTVASSSECGGRGCRQSLASERDLPSGSGTLSECSGRVRPEAAGREQQQWHPDREGEGESRGTPHTGRAAAWALDVDDDVCQGVESGEAPRSTQLRKTRHGPTNLRTWPGPDRSVRYTCIFEDIRVRPSKALRRRESTSDDGSNVQQDGLFGSLQWTSWHAKAT